MKWNIRRELIPLMVLLLFGIATLIMLPKLPDSVPAHFNLNGEVDGYESKSTFILTYLGMTLGLYLLLTFVPFIDPFWKRVKERYSIFLIIRDCMLVCMLAFYLVVILSAKSNHLSETGMGVAFGLVFVLFGNYMPRLPRNFFFGIRTPWTLASDYVWRRSHAVGGGLWVLSGILIITLSIAGAGLKVTLVSVLTPLLLFTGLIYPYAVYRKQQKDEKPVVPQL